MDINNPNEVRDFFAESQRNADAYWLNHAWKEANRPDVAEWNKGITHELHTQLGMLFLIEKGNPSEDGETKARDWVAHIIKYYDEKIKN
ncbi:TPA: hypothetical protein ACODIZ_003651 [Salmonella enterica subsp. enterica serovar Newport]